jgi:hypothetical protein
LIAEHALTWSVRIFEVSIRYAGRTYQEGKKIGWTDGVRAMAPILRFRFSDYLYVEDAYLREPNPRAAQPRTALHSMMADVIRPYVGAKVLEARQPLNCRTAARDSLAFARES